MKKIIVWACAILLLVGCEKKVDSEVVSNNDVKEERQVLKVGATPVPHAEILEFVKPDLEKEGIELRIVPFSDYVTPNASLNDGSLDANFFQHKPFLETTKNERGFRLEAVADVHIEPLGLYSRKFKNTDFPEGVSIAIPNDPSNGGRALILLHNAGLIKLADPSNLTSTEFDIIENPKDIKIKPIEAAMLPRTLDDVDAAVINGNYALQAELKSSDALILEGAESPYVNILVVQESHVNDEKIQKLISALQSQKLRDFIKQKYHGEIIPVF